MTAFTSGTNSAPIEIALDPGYELRFTMVRGGSWSGEVVLQIQETVLPDNSWEGPTISGNTITFDSVDNNPLTVGLALFNCDVNDYSINTESNTISIGQNAVLNEGCIWNDVGSSLIGSDQSGSVGYDDAAQSFGFDITLDGTQISGFETGITKAGGGLLTLSGGASVTAGAGGVGVEAVGIEVSAIGATVDGGSTGVGMHIEDSPYGWFYPMDVSGLVGVHAINSEILWDVGSTDASTAIRTENVRGTIQSITDNSGSNTGAIQIDAQSDSRLTVIDFPLDETRMLVDGTSIVEEANWLTIDANHLGGEPVDAVGLSIISDNDYTAYSSPVFEGTMQIDGDQAIGLAAMH